MHDHPKLKEFFSFIRTGQREPRDKIYTVLFIFVLIGVTNNWVKHVNTPVLAHTKGLSSILNWR